MYPMGGLVMEMSVDQEDRPWELPCWRPAKDTDAGNGAMAWMARLRDRSRRG